MKKRQNLGNRSFYFDQIQSKQPVKEHWSWESTLPSKHGRQYSMNIKLLNIICCIVLFFFVFFWGGGLFIRTLFILFYSLELRLPFFVWNTKNFKII